MAIFSVEKRPHMAVITCPEALGAESLKELVGITDQLMAEDIESFVFDFKRCANLGQETYRYFIKLKQQLAACRGKVFSVNLAKGILKQITDGGLDLVFNPFPDLKAVEAHLGVAPAPAPTSPQTIEFIKPFISAVQIAISTQASTPVTAGKPFAKKSRYEVDIAIAGVINLLSQQFVGSIALLFPEKVFLEIYTNMLGEPLTSITKESEDAAGELLNIIFGLAKMKLNNEKGYTIQRAIPTVLSGEKLRIADSGVGSAIALPFETKAGPFFVEIVFDPSPAGA